MLYAGADSGEASVSSGIALSDQLIEELREADDIVISSALYNFGMPSGLKGWIDHIVRFGGTFTTAKMARLAYLQRSRFAYGRPEAARRKAAPNTSTPFCRRSLPTSE